MVQIHVSQLRKVLPAGVLATRAPGYQLDLAPERVDVSRFERRLREGRAALAEFSEPFVQGEVPRLQDMHLAALEVRIEADPALGGDPGLVGELEALILRHPLRERLRAQMSSPFALAPPRGADVWRETSDRHQAAGRSRVSVR